MLGLGVRRVSVGPLFTAGYPRERLRFVCSTCEVNTEKPAQLKTSHPPTGATDSYLMKMESVAL
jgi:hypothetical protein